jgi:5-methylcytosine-specific restriction enzyme A
VDVFLFGGNLMARKPLKPCKSYGCPDLTRERYCENHKQLNNQYDLNRGTAAQRGYGARWRKARSYYLSKNLICVRCGGIATVVDHIKAHKGDMNLFWDTNNWQSLCKTCHDRKTVKEDGGFGNG